MSRKGSEPYRAATQRVAVRTALREGSAYDVVVGMGVLSDAGVLTRDALGPGGERAARALLAHDDALPRGLVNATAAAFTAAGLNIIACPVRASEAEKSFATVERIVQAAASGRLERGEPVVALGGGVVGDVAGFAAACYRRGVPVVQCPTTLLSMVDASVGGKTGVNVRVGDSLKKNMAGAFHQPALVLCDVATMQSLPARDLRSGLAECIKHAMIGADFGDADLLDLTRSALDHVLGMDAGALVELVSRNVAVKAACVGGDERETLASDAPHGGRMALNAGHTVAHAIETLPGLSHGRPSLADLTHGEAVGLGLLAEARLAATLGLLDGREAEELREVLERAGLPTAVRGLPDSARIIALMGDDKKVAGGRLRVSLPARGRRCTLADDPPRDALAAAIDTVRGD
ncbi:MAG: 3-dehydroquinate synthase [Phycisphaeraceae bacterium]|nr:3-dehydroquinate synthase [Phycisphaeraceae bacterium]